MAVSQHTCDRCGGQFPVEVWAGKRGPKPSICGRCKGTTNGKYRAKSKLAIIAGLEREKAKRAARRKSTACEGCGKTGGKTVKGLCRDCSNASIKIMRARRMRVIKGRSPDLVPYFGASGNPVCLTCADCGESFTVQGDSGRVRGIRRRFCSRECQKRSSDRVRTKARRAATRGALAVERVDPTLVFARDSWKCQICGVKTLRSKRGQSHPKAPELDHIMPLSLGGDHSYQNTQCTCRSCNIAKGARPMGQLMLFPSAA